MSCKSGRVIKRRRFLFITIGTFEGEEKKHFILKYLIKNIKKESKNTNNVLYLLMIES